MKLKLFATTLLLIISLSAAPVFAATYSQPITAFFGLSYTGQVNNVGYTVFDNAGTTQINRTTSGITEINDAAGSGAGEYLATITVTTSWLPIRVHWDITNKAGVVADAIIGSDRAAGVGDGFTGTLATNVGTTNTRITSTVTPPTNWSSESIDGSGRVLLQPSQPSVVIPTVTTLTTNSDKTGYSLTQSFPSNFASTNIDSSGRVLLQPSEPSVTISATITDPWLTLLPGSYSAGTAGAILGGISSSSTTPGTPPTIYINPILPTNFAASSPSANTITCTWTASVSSNIAYYDIKRDNQLFKISSTATSFSDTGLISGFIYHYSISTVTTSGNMSPFSAVIAVTSL